MSDYRLATTDDDIYDLVSRTKSSHQPATRAEKRVLARSDTNQLALDCKRDEVVRAIRNDAVVSGVAIEAHRTLTNYGYDQRDAQTREDDRNEVEMAVDQWVKRHNKAAQAYHKRFTEEQQEILDRELIVPDNRSALAKLLLDPEE